MDSKDKRQLAKQRRENARQAQKYHKEQEKQNKKASQRAEGEKKTDAGNSKIRDAVNARRDRRQSESRENLSREERFRRDGEEKIRKLRPEDHEGGYFIDEYAEKQRQERRARIIRKHEREVIRRNKKPVSHRQARMKHIIFSVGIVVGVLVVGVILSFTVLFKTETIKVEGDVYYNKQQIIDFSNVHEQQNIFTETWNSTPEEIVRNLPYVESAQVNFSVPDTIVISVKNAVPTYAVQDGDGYLVVSSKGRILDTTDVKAEDLDLVELRCGEIKDKSKGAYIDFGDDTVSDILHSVAKSFAANGVDDITAFDITNLSAIMITYDNRIDINIGLPDDIEYKIKTAFTIINEKLDPNNTGKIAGTLDVSTCNKNKMSRYKPSPTAPELQQPETVPETTAPDALSGGEDATVYNGRPENYDGNGYLGEPANDIQEGAYAGY